MEDHQMELQLLPTSSNTIPSQSHAATSSWSTKYDDIQYHTNIASPSLDLQLSNTTTSFQPVRPSSSDQRDNYNNDHIRGGSTTSSHALKWQISDQHRMESMEKAYVERVREMTQREMELARSEMSCARHMWETAQQEVQRAEKMKERATQWIDDSTTNCVEITCQACKRTFRP